MGGCRGRMDYLILGKSSGLRPPHGDTVAVAKSGTLVARMRPVMNKIANIERTKSIYAVRESFSLGIWHVWGWQVRPEVALLEMSSRNWLPRMAAMGHEDQFPSPRPSDRCRFSQETFGRPSGNG